MHFTDDDIKHIKDASEKHLIDVVQDFRNLRKSGTSYVCDCPMCKAGQSVDALVNGYGYSEI